MGDPKLMRKKFATPSHPWQSSRIEEERQLVKEYGLKNKSEVWKMRTKAKNFADQAKRLTAQKTSQSKKEEGHLLARLYNLGLLQKGEGIDDLLGITIKDILERRLQTIVFKKGLARSINQARQFITHQHIALKNKIVTAPSYLVLVSEEDKVSFIPKSPLANSEHPERVIEKAKPKPKEAKPAKKRGKREKPKKEKIGGKSPEKKEKSAKGESKEQK